MQKIAFITKQLYLTPKEAQKFWPVYNQFSNERKQLHHQHKKNRSDEDHAKDIDNFEFKNAKKINIKINKKISFNLLYNNTNSLHKKIMIEQIRKEIKINKL